MGRLDLGHSDSSVFGLRMRADFNRIHGVNSSLIEPKEIHKMIPALDLREGKPLPVMAALYHPPGGVVRHDAVVWGYGSAAHNLGVELHPFTEVTRIDQHNKSIIGVETTRGYIKTNTILSATAGWTSTIGAMLDLKLPIITHPLQAFVTEPLKPFMDISLSLIHI